MTPDEFQDAVRKGLGRAIQHLRSGAGSEPCLDAIQDAVTHCLAWDSQSEGSRGQYLFDLIQLSGQRDQLAAIASESLRTAPRSDEIWQLSELCMHLAKAGYTDARAALYDRVGTIRPPEDTVACVSEIVELDDLKGLVEVMNRLGSRILGGEELMDEASQVLSASQSLDESIRESLEAMAVINPAVRACLTASLESERKNSESASPRLNVEGMTYVQLRQQIEAVHGKFSFGHLTKWEKHATDADLHAAASDLLAETRSDYLLTYLRLFFRRPFPLSLTRIIEIADTAEDRLSHAALYALAAVQHPAVRDFGIALLRRRHRLENAVMYHLQSRWLEEAPLRGAFS